MFQNAINGEDIACSALAFYDTYVEHCTSTEKKPLAKYTVTALLQKLFPNVSVKKQHINGMRQEVYFGIWLVQDLEQEILKFSEIKDIIEENDKFVLTVDREDKFQAICATDHTINDMFVYKVIEMERGKPLELKVGNQEVPEGVVGIALHALNQTAFKALLHYFASAEICMGKEADRRVIGSEKWIDIKENTYTYRKRSPSCAGIISPLGRVQLCRNCKGVVVTIPEQEDTSFDGFVKKYLPGATDSLQALLRDQSKHLMSKAENGDTRSHRFSKACQSLALSIYLASPMAYQIFSNIFILPSLSMVRAYKEALKQDNGLNKNTVEWLCEEATRLDAELCGFILIEDSNIQKNISDTSLGEALNLMSMVHLQNEMANVVSQPMGIIAQKQDSDYVQLMFVGFHGFRFPLAFCPLDIFQGPQVVELITKAVNILKTRNIEVTAVSFNGKAADQRLIDSLELEPNSSHISGLASVNDAKVAALSDFTHVIVELRNELYTSGTATRKIKLLRRRSGTMTWSMLKDAYKWDVETSTMLVNPQTSQQTPGLLQCKAGTYS